MVYHFNGYCAPIQNVHCVYLLKCTVYGIKGRKGGSRRISGEVPSYKHAYIIEAERMFAYRISFWEVRLGAVVFSFCISVISDFFTMSM